MIMSEEIFTIAINDLHKHEPVLYYSPLTGKKSFTSLMDEDASNPHMRSLSSIRDLRKMSVLPNHRCNFNCSYCYAAQGRDTSELDKDTIDTALKFFIDRERCSHPLSIAILGGGEPMLSYETTLYTISRARELAEEQGLKLELTLVTNASIVNAAMISSLVEHNVIVNASFDLLEDVQEKQRKSFSLVKDNIQLMNEGGVYVTINATITPLNVDRMDEMVRNAHNWFPKVEFMIFEPVIESDMFHDHYALRDFYDKFLTNFFVSRDYARELGIGLTCRILKSLDSCQDRGCDGRFNICPNGDITICYCTASPKDPNFENRWYGKVSSQSVIIDQERFKKICDENVFSFEKCSSCFAKYNCAGGCMLPNDRYSIDYLEEVCRFNREFIRRELVNTLNEKS